MIRTPLSRSEGQGHQVALLTRRRVGASGSCSGGRENVLGVGNYCCVACARRREALRHPQKEERGGGPCHAHSWCFAGLISSSCHHSPPPSSLSLLGVYTVRPRLRPTVCQTSRTDGRTDCSRTAHMMSIKSMWPVS